jgi:hypothetical protein
MIDQETGAPQIWRLEGDAFRRVEGLASSEVTGLEYTRGREGLEVRDPRTGRRWTI